jgi:hypothetical protein
LVQQAVPGEGNQIIEFVLTQVNRRSQFARAAGGASACTSTGATKANVRMIFARTFMVTFLVYVDTTLRYSVPKRYLAGLSSAQL